MRTKFQGGAALLGVVAGFGCQPAVTKIDIEPASAVLTTLGQGVAIKAVPKDDKGELVPNALLALTWKSSDPAVVVLEGQKWVAKKSGEVTVSATYGKVSGAAKIKVSIPASVAFEPASLEVNGVEQVVAVKPIVKDDRGEVVEGAQIVWSTKNPRVAMVDDGKVRSVGAGEGTIEAVVNESIRGSLKVTVKLPPVERLAIEPGSLALAVGEGSRLTVKAFGAQDAEVKGIVPTFATSDEKTATVSAEGLVTAVKKGKAKITASFEGKSATLELTVK